MNSAALALQAAQLHTFYGKSHILHDVGLEVREGEIVTVLGRNGAGKSTTLRSLVGLTPPRQGTVEIFGRETTQWPPYRIAALGVGLCSRRTARLPQFDGRRKPDGAAGAPRAVDDRAGPRTLSAIGRACATARGGSFPAASRRCWRSPAL